MGKKILPFIAVLLGGGLGYALRGWQLRAGYEPDTGLAIPGAPSALALIVCTAAVVLLVVALCRKWQGKSQCAAAFAWIRGNTLYAAAVAVAGILFLAAAVLTAPGLAAEMAQARTGENLLVRMAGQVLPPARMALGVLAAPCAILWGRAVYRGDRDAMKENLGLLELCLLQCLYLISDYQSHSGDPVTMNYVYQVLAMVCSLLALYYLAGYSFQEGKPRRCLFFCLMSYYFCAVVLADGGDLPRMLNYVAVGIFLVAQGEALRSAPASLTGSAKEEGEAEHG